METFTIGMGRLWWLRVLSRNPLVRRSDRIEVFVLCWAILLWIVALPAAVAIGTSVHDTRARLDTEQAQTRHQVTATAIEGTGVEIAPNALWFTARATWKAAERDHVGFVRWPSRAKHGDRESIWVDSTGENVPAPAPSSRADSDGVGAAVVVFFRNSRDRSGFSVFGPTPAGSWALCPVGPRDQCLS